MAGGGISKISLRTATPPAATRAAPWPPAPAFPPVPTPDFTVYIIPPPLDDGWGNIIVTPKTVRQAFDIFALYEASRPAGPHEAFESFIRRNFNSL